MVLKIQQTTLENIDLSNISIKSGTLLRINFTDLKKYKKCFYNKNCFSFNQDVINLYHWGKKVSRKNLFFVHSSKELLINYLDYNYDEINEFEELMYPNYKEKGLTSPLNEKITSLPYGDRMLLYCKLYSEKNIKPIIIGTAGMHLHNLKITYQLLNSFLLKGGKCVELTYPQMKDSEIDEIFKNQIKII